jgi:hypothetical protein
MIKLILKIFFLILLLIFFILNLKIKQIDVSDMTCKVLISKTIGVIYFTIVCCHAHCVYTETVLYCLVMTWLYPNG